MKTIPDHKSLIDILGGNTVVARLISTPDDHCQPVRVQQWKLSNSIPPQNWPRLIEIAEAKEIEGVTAEWFMRTVPPRKRTARAA